MSENSTLELEMDQAVEAEAKKMGWAPKDKWRGDPDIWIDAEAFVQRGRDILPIVRAQKEELEAQVAALNARDSAREVEFRSVKATLKAVEDHMSKDLAARATDLREELISGIAAASESGDHAGLAKLSGELSQLDAAVAAKGGHKAAEETQTQPAQTVNPHFDVWAAENSSWFRGATKEDKTRTRAALLVAQELAVDRPELRGKRDFYDAVDDALADMFPNAPRPRESRVAGGRSAGGEGGGEGAGTKTYGSLPADAKGVCDRQAKLVVGAGKAYKTQADWQKAYAKEYWAQER